MILEKAGYLSFYGAVAVGKGVIEGVFVGALEVIVKDGVNVGVYVAVEINVDVKVGEGVIVDVLVGIKVADGVFVIGWNGVDETVGVEVAVGEGVRVGVLVIVPVTMGGVRLRVGI